MIDGIKYNQLQSTYSVRSRVSSKLSKALLFLCVLWIPSSLLSQEINFGNYSSQYSMTLTEISPGTDLEFGMVIQNEGLKNIPLLNAKQFELEGVKYLDVIVDITADNFLLLDGDLGCQTDPSCRLPFTLQAAFANRGNNDTNQATQMSVLSNIASAQFPILQRGNGPPGPPPTPVYEGYNPSLYLETAYLYIYGSVSVGNIDAGTYTADITISISYD